MGLRWGPPVPVARQNTQKNISNISRVLLKSVTGYDEEVRLKRSSALLADPDEPQSYKELMKSENAEKWKKAIEEEYNSLIMKETCRLDKLPSGHTAIRPQVDREF